jgi:hypothetical protein
MELFFSYFLDWIFGLEKIRKKSGNGGRNRCPKNKKNKHLLIKMLILQLNSKHLIIFATQN